MLDKVTCFAPIPMLKADGSYTTENLFPEGHSPYFLSPSAKKGITFPIGTNQKLLGAADDLVNALNRMWQQKGHEASTELRESIVRNTADLSEPWSSLYNQVGAASYLQITLKVLEQGDPVSREAAPKLRRFIEAFAQTRGASQCTCLALVEKIFDAKEVIAKLHHRQLAQTRKAPAPRR